MSRLNRLQDGLPEGHLRSVVEEVRGELFEAGNKLATASNLHPDLWLPLEAPVAQIVDVFETVVADFEVLLGLDEDERRDRIEQHVQLVRYAMRSLERRLPS